MRLAAQQLNAGSKKSIGELVTYMGAMQAQDFPMSKWGIGCRLKDITQHDVNTELARASIIRTHVLRPTWHIVASSDLMWMLELTAPNILRITRGYHKSVEITPKILKASISLIEKTLRDGIDLSRTEIAAVLKKQKINTDENRLAHLLMDAELNGLICSGPVENNSQRYRLIPEQIKKAAKLDRDEAIQQLAARYFKSHGPATIRDFHWWSGLSIADCRIGIKLNSENLSSYDDEGIIYYFDETACSFSETKKQHHLVPAFDEFFVGYKDRSTLIAEKHNIKLFTNNGMFFPALLTNGRATGTWKRKINNEKVNIDIQIFSSPSTLSMRSLKSQVAQFGKFLGKEVSIKIG
jgi:hypothetical protein